MDKGLSGMVQCTNLLQIAHKPEYSDWIFVSYEGENIGMILFEDIVEDMMDAKSLNHGQIIILGRTDLVEKSLYEGVIRRYSDPTKYRGNPPLFTYRFVHFI